MSSFRDVAETDELKGKGTTPKGFVTADRFLGIQLKAV